MPISWRATAIRRWLSSSTAIPSFVDVNVHPAKTEVRFRDAGLVRGLIVSSLKAALSQAGHRASTTVAGAALSSFRPQGTFVTAFRPQSGAAEVARTFHARLLDGTSAISARVEESAADAVQAELPLGAARAQLHETYIVAQTADGHRHRRPACRPRTSRL